MPPLLPDRYQLEVRLGRDDDVEEWLATDKPLDRPVLIRIVGPETTEERRSEFLDAVRGAAGVTHTHLASIFAADLLPDGAYSISEWAGGLTLENRMQAGETMPVLEFLPNAAGLAEALSALHERGILHGAIEQRSILFSLDHPAKLAGFGRHTEGGSAGTDVQDLANALVTAVTGAPTPDVPPSQVIDGLSPGVDRVIHRAQAGELAAGQFAELLRAAPSSTGRTQARDRTWSWRRILPAVGLLATAIILFAVGRLINTGTQDPLLFPVSPGATTEQTPATSSTLIPVPANGPSSVSISEVIVFDPEGDGSEHDLSLSNLTDGNTATSWTTERYIDPLPLIKGGVGFAVGVEGTPTGIELLGSSGGTSYRLLWAPAFAPALSSWEAVASGSIRDGRGSIQLPARTNGYWLVWLTDIPADPDGGYVGGIGEVRFQP